MNRFSWSRQSDITTATGPLPRVEAAPATGLRIIPPDPVDGALTALFEAIAAGQEFCIAPDAAPGGSDTTPDADFFQTMTSGTSGVPKRIRRSHRSWTDSFEITRQSAGITPGDSYAVLGSLGHSLSLYAVLEAACLGADALVLTGQRPDQQLGALARTPASIVYATPVQLGLLWQAARKTPGASLPGTRKLYVGGASLDPASRAQAEALFPAAEIHVFYGTAETSFITLASADDPADAAGRPYPGVEIDIRNPDGTPLPPGETGEIWVRSPYLFRGYTGGKAPDTRWRDGYLTVGELGRLDGAGRLYLAGRKSRMFTVADQNVFPEAVETFLMGLDGVDRAGVVACPDPLRGSVPVAFVSGAVSAADTGELLRHCRQGLGPVAAPRAIHMLDDWPLLPSGKTDYRALERLTAGASA